MRFTINSKEYCSEEDLTILEFCIKNSIEIPHLCYHPDLFPEGRCRLCVVDIGGGRLVSACNTKLKEGLVIKTETDEIVKSRKLNVELMLNHHHKAGKNDEDNELMRLAGKLGITLARSDERNDKKIDDSNPALYRDNNKCILCGRCVQKCDEVQSVNAIGYANRGHFSEIVPPYDHCQGDYSCVFCGQCALVCPAGAITERSYIEDVKKAIDDLDKIVIVQTAPAVRAAIGEAFGMPYGSISTGKMVTALRMLGFDRVLDTDFAADLTILEEGTELIKRIQKKGVMPMFTSCCPGWVKYIEHFHPDMLSHLSTCKSPQQMFGAMLKTYYAQKNNIPAEKIVSVSIMPCTAKKFEASRSEMSSSGYRDVDYVITTREFAKMVKDAKIDFANLADGWYDPIMGASSGAGAIFGVTGGVMEAALRFAADVLTGKDLPDFEFHQVRESPGVKEATIDIAGTKLNVAIVNGLKNAEMTMNKIKKGEVKYDFVEVMCCPGGCIGGGGQIMPTTKEIIRQRREGLYSWDRRLTLRKSHKNHEIIALYDEFLEKPGSHKAHEYLHTSYIKRNRFGN